MNVGRVRQSVMDDPRQSLRSRAASLNLNKSTIHRIIPKDLHFDPYKIVIVQKMKPDDRDKRGEFCRTVKNRLRSFNNIWFSDQFNIYINGHVNKQNCRSDPCGFRKSARTVLEALALAKSGCLGCHIKSRNYRSLFFEHDLV